MLAGPAFTAEPERGRRFAWRCLIHFHCFRDFKGVASRQFMHEIEYWRSGASHDAVIHINYNVTVVTDGFQRFNRWSSVVMRPSAISRVRNHVAVETASWKAANHRPPLKSQNIIQCVLLEIHLINQMSRMEEKDPIGYWRSDAEASFSDFVIVVREDEEDGLAEKDETSSAEDRTTKTYHVHRCHLCCGPRHSEYFRRLFSNDFHETKDARVSFKFSSGMAREFPAFLDYLYGAPAESIELGTSQPWCLGKLADYFGVELLLKDTISSCALQMFSITAEEFEKRSESMSPALSVLIMKEVMAVAKTREQKVWNAFGKNTPASSIIKMV
jgi:BTB/POZ domain